MRKQLDNRIPILINNNVKRNHRSFIVLVGDKGRDQVVNLHFLLSQARVSARPSVLWCYKKDLGFTSHRKKREAKIKRDVKRGIREANEQDPFEIFVTVTDIRYTQESHKVLGNTYGMCVLQDFEAITPNLLARTIETVEGGGLVVLLLKTMSSLKQLYTMSMDVHARYRTSSHDSVVARFNERFILSLASCDDCLVLDDELNVLPISRGKDIEPIDEAEERGKGKQIEDELTELKESLADTKPIGELVKLAKTTDQAKALLTFVEAIAEKTLSSTVALTAARGRGKSAALGMAIAASLAHGYSNIFVTSPSPENLKTLFDFIFKGMDALGYEEHLDYDIVQSTNPDFNKAIVRVNVFREHRQTIQYIQPQDAHVLGKRIRNLLGPYLVFMASTINGYEGTGRSLSLKLIQQLRESTRPVIAKSNDDSLAPASNSKKSAASGSSGIKARTLREIKLETPIRYGSGDKVEKWLHSVLCLDATVVSRGISGSGCPHPSQCELFYVNRDTLFSYNPASEVFLQRMMALFVSSHYKNSPNDLQLMSDAPAHHLFVLLPPLRDDESTLPDPLVVLQVALEGNISKQAILESLSRGLRSGGDLIPWIISQQFQDNNFAELSGARIVRIATHPDYASMGYGSRALKALESFYNGELFNLDEAPEETQEEDYRPTIDPNATLLTDKVAVRSATQMPPLLQRLSQRKPEVLDYVGVSYGLSPQLLRFWKRAGYCPLYLRQTTSDLTGENTCVMVKNLGDVLEGEEHWIGAFAQDFRRRFLTLLSFQFREFGSASALSILEAIANTEQKSGRAAPGKLDWPDGTKLPPYPFDLKRLEAYSNSLIDYHVRLGPDVKLNAIQSSIMLSLGLQRKSELDIPVNQALALFVKAIRKICARLQNLHKESLGADIPSQPSQPPAKADGTDWKPLAQTVEEELQEAGNEVTRELKAKQREMIDALDLSSESKSLGYAIDHTSADWVQAEAHVAKLADPNRKKDVSTVVSLKSSAQAGAKKRARGRGDGPAAGAEKKEPTIDE
ncbi:RNA cytidine acetyltransferase 1 [Rhizoctonia solani]|uniref:RNA cytidine acetyltransferase n=1 Tax=Rhizoctonia solani TaxID=456999 RepID=A0A8H7IG17_9AGAM|nr:RNA cytidine acetyltransferase 1 [Rhizoctonia solani]